MLKSVCSVGLVIRFDSSLQQEAEEDLMTLYFMQEA